MLDISSVFFFFFFSFTSLLLQLWLLMRHWSKDSGVIQGRGWVGLDWGDDWHLPYSTAFWWWSNSIYILTHTLGLWECRRPQAQTFPTASSVTTFIWYSKHGGTKLLVWSEPWLCFLNDNEDSLLLTCPGNNFTELWGCACGNIFKAEQSHICSDMHSANT